MCFQCSSKDSQSYNMYKTSPQGFLMLFCHMFIDAPEKLPKFGAFSILGTALGQAEKTGAKELNVFEPEESSNEELEVAEKEELTRDVSGEPKEGVPK